ncbi:MULTISPECIES: YciI family protein [unclassified Chelatococcus]|uniref:YciI family protein n=1 Tax=unclassified Chelatococcus TaxID=2638111 RepID=UPI0003744FE4|nr:MULTISPECIES: YciI family protein [unclassified Chelatococcus]ALA17710.1 hypothetical protein AL346_10225 [Chelatococcus sp. CO-6]
MSDAAGPDSVPVADVMEASRGMLQKQLYAIATTPTNGLAAVFAHMEAHLAFQVELERKGIMFAAGPIWTDDEQSWRGEGLVIIRAASRQEAVAIAAEDPMHKAGARSFTVRPWMVNEGSLTVRLDFSKGKFSIS